MPSYAVLCEETCPLLQFSNSGTEWALARTTDNVSYSGGTSLVTTSQNASVALKFYGTAVSIHGTSQGAFSATLDGKQVSPFPMIGVDDGESSDEEDPVAAPVSPVLFSASRDAGVHEIVLKRMEEGMMVVDYVSFEGNAGESDEPLIVHRVLASDEGIKYSPAHLWTPHLGTFSNKNARKTKGTRATARIEFRGDAIAVYGSIGPSGTLSPATVRIDDQDEPRTYLSTRAPVTRSNQLVYFAGSLGPGKHSIEITTRSVEGDDLFEDEALLIDYMEVYTTESLGGSYAKLNGTNSPSLIIGVVVTSALAGMALLLLAYVFVRYRKGHLPLRAEKLLFPSGRGRARREEDSSNGPLTATPD